MFPYYVEAGRYAQARVAEARENWRVGMGGDEESNDPKFISLAERGALVGTYGRLAIVQPLCVAVASEDVLFTASIASIVVAADIWDGWYNRKHDLDTDRRRLADAVTDRIIAGSAFLTLSKTNPEIIRYSMPMLAIGALTSSIGLLSYVKYKTLLLSSKMHRAGSLSALAFGLAGVSGNQTAIAATAAATTGINGILATNYAGGFLSMREQTVDDIGNEIGEKKQRKKIKSMQGSKWLLSKLTSKTVSNESVFV